MSKSRNNHRDRLGKDASAQDRDDPQTRDSRQLHGRRGLKDESDPWSRHSKAPDDKERRSRRTGDWEEHRVGERRDRASENQRNLRKSNGEYQNHERRNGHWRSQDGPLWSQDDEALEDDHKSGNRTQSRNFRDRGKQGPQMSSKGWGRTAQQDEDPLWMDAAETAEEKKNGPTQADFEEFRAKMKAQDSKKTEILEATTDRGLNSEHPNIPPTNITSKGKADRPLDLGDFSDKFYDMLSQPKKQQTKESLFAEKSKEEVVSVAVKMAKSSKFSSLFNTDPQTKSPILNEPPVDASSEDKAGFQRILKLLDQQQRLPQGEVTPPIPSNQDASQASSAFQSPNRRHHEEPRSPPPLRDPQTNNRDFLLNLIKQPQQGQPEPNRQPMNIRREPDSAPGMVPFSNLAMSPPQETPVSMHPSGPPPGFFDEGHRHEISRQDKLNPNGPPLPRGAIPGLHDLFGGPGRPSALPPGLERRPPGFDHLPPGYSQHAQAAQQAGLPPPPGFPPPQQRGIGVGGMGPGVYGARSNGPGMPPPPGFPTNMGGPPPPGFVGKNAFGGHDAPFGAGAYDFGQGFGPPPGQQRR